MKLYKCYFLFIGLILHCVFGRQRNTGHVRPEEQEPVFTNRWAVHTEHGVEKAEELALKHGFKFHGQIGGLKDYYLFEHSAVQTRSRRSLEHHNRLSSEPIVRWVEQQKVLKRTKREFRDFTDPLFKDQWYLKNRGEYQILYFYCAGMAPWLDH